METSVHNTVRGAREVPYYSKYIVYMKICVIYLRKYSICRSMTHYDVIRKVVFGNKIGFIKIAYVRGPNHIYHWVGVKYDKIQFNLKNDILVLLLTFFKLLFKLRLSSPRLQYK